MRLNLLISALALTLGFSAAHANGPECATTLRKLNKNLATAQVALLDQLEKEGRVKNDDLAVYDSICKPALDRLNALNTACSSTTQEQQAIVATAFNPDNASSRAPEQTDDAKPAIAALADLKSAYESATSEQQGILGKTFGAGCLKRSGAVGGK